MDMYAVWLTCRMGGATVKTSALLERFGSPEGIYHAGPQELAEAAKLSKQELEQLGRHELDDVRRLMERCASLGIEAVHPWEDAYPGQLTQISNRPFTLFYRGKLETVQNRLCVAVVGTRSCTRYGASVAEKLAGDLAACGVTVVSGMADGIDSCANLGALKADGKTVAVLGNGVDRAYPAHNGYLMEQIIESGGLVASEYPPGSAISKGNSRQETALSVACRRALWWWRPPKRAGRSSRRSLPSSRTGTFSRCPATSIPTPRRAQTSCSKTAVAKPVTETLDVLEEYLGSYGHLLSVVRESPPEQPERRVQRRSLLERVTGGRLMQKRSLRFPGSACNGS